MGKTILVIDDSPSMREMIAFTLKRAGYTILQSGDGQEALAKLGNERVALIITDLNMPVMDGMTFIKEARVNPRLKFTPILMLTTESQEEKKQEGKAAGATGWLVKPFDPQQLLSTIAQVLPS
ncbi:MAG: response regulator [Deltaproteobacteria bacterium]|nr:response regulator [Deltaproteobacteria bacterium]